MSTPIKIALANLIAISFILSAGFVDFLMKSPLGIYNLKGIPFIVGASAASIIACFDTGKERLKQWLQAQHIPG